MLKYLTKLSILVLSFGVLSIFSSSMDRVNAQENMKPNNQSQLYETGKSQAVPNVPRRIWHERLFSVDPYNPPHYIQHTAYVYGHFYSGPLGRTNITDGRSVLQYEGWLYLDDGTGPIPTMSDEI